MNILALESGAEYWGLACARITDDVVPLSITIESEPRALARELFAGVQSTLDAAQLSLQEIDGIAIGLGPGSWTGLRIGVTAMKTLAQVRSLPIVGVPSFDPLAQAVWRMCAASGTSLLMVAAPCRPGELYGKIYECGAAYLAVAQSEWIGSPQLLADTLRTESLARSVDAPLLLAGAAAATVEEILQSCGDEYTIVQPSPEQALLELAVAGAASLAQGEAPELSSLQPLYLAPSNAERNLLSR